MHSDWRFSIIPQMLASGKARLVKKTNLSTFALLFFVALCWLWPAEARADLRMCNMTTSRVGIAFGYHDAQGWISEGWWNLKANECETIFKGQLTAQYYYLYALDYDRGGDWSGQTFMCTRDREFSIRGIEDCLARGYDRSGFFEINSGNQKSWTVQLTDANRSAAR
jgi:uncharacterized membrane protein